MFSNATIAPVPATMPSKANNERLRKPFRLSKHSRSRCDTLITATEVPTSDIEFRLLPFGQFTFIDIKATIKKTRNICVVRHHDQCHSALTIQRQQQFQHAMSGMSVQITGRFVCKNNGWATHQGSGYGYPLALAS